LSLGVDPYLVARLGEPTFSGGLEVRFQCPCEACASARRDGKKEAKLYVNFAKGVFFCMRSSWGGPVKDLYSSVGLDYGGPEVKVPKDLRAAVGALDDTGQDGGGVLATGIEVPRTTTQWEHSDALIWLQSRLSTVPPEEIKELIQTGVIRRGVGRYWDRVFFVDSYRKVDRYWTARTYIDGFEPKYLNPYNVPRSRVMGNYERVEEEYHDEVIICEGAISAIVAGRNAVWTYGRCVTTEQIEMLDCLNCGRFVLVSEPDMHARQNTLELARALTKIRRECFIVDMPTEVIDGKTIQHDPASLGRPRFRRLVDETAVPFSWSAEVMRRLRGC
jgi:hypothetical protein